VSSLISYFNFESSLTTFISTQVVVSFTTSMFHLL